VDVASVLANIQQASLAATHIANETTALLARYGVGAGNAALTNTLVAGANAAAQYAATLASNQTTALNNLVAAWKMGHGCNGGASCTDTLVATSVTVGLTWFNAINDLNQVRFYELYFLVVCRPLLSVPTPRRLQYYLVVTDAKGATWKTGRIPSPSKPTPHHADLAPSSFV
jgi:hypothetical protein